MDKQSSEGKPCIYCGNTALPNTCPPVCEEHLTTKQASGEPGSLKELEWKEQSENGTN